MSELQTRQGADRTHYLLATAYHTAYVMGLLCAAALQPGCAPPTSISTKQGIPGSARQILPLLDDSSKTSHWRDTFDKLGSSQADALSGTLFNIALQRCAIRLGDSLGLTTTPAASQAAELLERVATFAATLPGSEPSGPTPVTFTPQASPSAKPTTAAPTSGTTLDFVVAPA
jgi:hypothetical protein